MSTRLIENPTAIILGLTALAALSVFAVGIDLFIMTLWIVSGVVILFAWAHRAASPDDRRLLLIGMFIGLGIRLLIYWVIYDSPHIYPDHRMYWYLGSRLADLYGNERVLDVEMIPALGTATGMFYYIWTALHVAIVKNEAFVIVSNIISGTGSGILTYKIGRQVWDGRVALAGAWLVWLSSAMAQLDVQNMREAIIIFALLCAIYGGNIIAERWNTRGTIWFSVGIALLLQIRSYIGLLVIGTIAIALFVMRRKGRVRILIIMSIIIGLLFAFVASTQLVVIAEKLGEGSTFVDMIVWGHLGLVANKMQGSTLANVHLTSLQDILMFIPIGLGHIIVAPLPWKASGIDTFFIPDVLLRYVTFPLFVVGTIHTIRTDWRRAFTVLSVAGAIALLYSVLELGGNVRHHLQFFPILYLLTVYGWTVVRHYEVTAVLSGLALSAAIWAYTLGSVSFAMRFFAVLGIALFIWVFVAMHFEYRQPPSVSK